MDPYACGGTVRRRSRRWAPAVAALMAVGACASEPEDARTTTSAPQGSSDAGVAPSVRDVMEIDDFAPLEPGAYSIDPDVRPTTPLRVVYEVPAEGWTRWIGAAKFAGDGHVGVTITTVTNVVRHGCTDHAWADPPVGPGVDDLAAALADLAPFTVTSPPEEVSAYGYRGMHLAMTVPNLPMEGEGEDRSFTGCLDGQVKSWVAAIDTEPGDAFYGYTGPGYVEEFWILDVDGTRLMIAAGQSPGSPAEDVEEMRMILESIRIEG